MRGRFHLLQRVYLLLSVLLFCSQLVMAQKYASANYYEALQHYDMSKLWRGDSIYAEDNEKERMAFPEPLGYIGDDYQRFYIHYTSVVKSKTNPCVYHVAGKTRVKNNICSFTGTITVREATKNKDIHDITGAMAGSAVCDVLFYEDSTQSGSGVIKGVLNTDFYFDKRSRLRYDALMMVADGYCNNQCEARWTSYKTGKSKKCNWGDFRMPDSNDLDSGAGDVVINEKYAKYGWESFIANNGSDEATAKQARLMEEAQWWK